MFRIALSAVALLVLSVAPVASTQAAGHDDSGTVTLAGNKQWCC